MTEFLRWFLDPVPVLAGAVIAAVAGHLWRRFRHRMVTLRCQVTHTPVLNSGAIGEQLELKYGGVAAPHLFMCNVAVENDSSRDLEDVVLSMVYRDGTVFLQGGGTVIGSNHLLPFSPNYEAIYLRALEEQSSVDAFGSQREFMIAVLNRGGRVQFAFSVHGTNAEAPNLFLACEHVGVRVVLQPPRQLFWGEPSDRAALLGLLIGVVILLILPWFVSSSWGVSWTMLLFGALTVVVGAAAMKVWRTLLRVLS